MGKKNEIRLPFRNASLAASVVLFFALSALRADAAIYTDADGSQIRLTIIGCNSNFICEPEIGEDFMSCSSDCEEPPPEPPPASTSTPVSPTSHTSAPLAPHVEVRSIDIFASTTADSASVTWKTSQTALSSFAWGRTLLYENGNSSEYAGSMDHSTRISGLIPGTKYYFRIITNTAYFGDNTYFGSFVTLPKWAPPIARNVSEFSLSYYDADGAHLRWKNPAQDFSEVYIVRSPFFYPSSPDDGRFVYEGRASSATDRSVSPGETYYYSLFVKGKSGEYSSGIGIAFKTGQGIIGNPASGLVATSSNRHFDLKVSDLSFIQDGAQILGGNDGTILLQSGKDTEVDWNSATGTASVKKGILSFFDDKTGFAYIFKQDGTNFHSSIESLSPGKYPFSVALYDAKNNLLAQTEGTFDARLQGEDFSVKNARSSSFLASFIQALVSYLLSVIDWIRGLLHM